MYDYAFHFRLDAELSNEEMAEIEDKINIVLEKMLYIDFGLIYCIRTTLKEEEEWEEVNEI